ncbi:MAG TPA: EamA family transporter [Anaerolineales bacterium]|jgi:drug/metabolite transporter (DMT)-like permease|nr:EamA family transporter [Anaerolineales bacterium]
MSSAYLHLGIVYLVWGSTYLAIRVAVREGSGFPPFSMGASRVILAGLLLLGWAALSRKRVRLTGRELLVLGGSGLLLWSVGNGLVLWAEQRADSSLAALMVGTTPIWAVLIEAALDRRRPSPLLLAGLFSGLLGIGLLSAPVLAGGVRADVLSVVALALAAIAWAMGSVLQNRNPVDLALRVSSGYQHLAGGIGFLVLVLLMREPLPRPQPQALAAWGYLLVFGSLIAFTSYVQTLRKLPMSIATTNAFVNPVIAVILGAALLQEPITPWKVSGAALVLLAVAGAFRDRQLQRSRVPSQGEAG